MNSANRFLNGFAQSWREKSNGLHTESSPQECAASIAALEQAWEDACQHWWANLRHVVPDSLQAQLEGALQQTRLCIRLALRAEQVCADDIALMVSPAAGLHATVRALHQSGRSPPTPAERRYLRACEAMVAWFTQIARGALTAAHEQLCDGQDRTPRELHACYATIMEECYRQHAAGDEFAELAGQWVSAHVDIAAARRRANTSDTQTSTAALHEGLDVLSAGRPDRPLRSSSGAPAAYSPTIAPLSQQIAQQLRRFSDKLTAGTLSLPELPAEPVCGVSTKELVLQCDGVKLLRYRRTPQKHTTEPTLPPLLLVYSLVNRPYILDLNDERSFIRALCDAGRDVYLIDWGYPDEQDSCLGLDDYINRYLHACVMHLQETSPTCTVDLIGICQGGPFALCYTALEPTRVRRLVLMAAPIDFHSDDFLLTRWLRHIDVESLVSTLGNVPGYLLNWSFIALRPWSLSGTKALELLDVLDCPHELAAFAQMQHWLHDNPDQAGRAFVEFVQSFVRNNALVNASACIGARTVDLRAVHHPVLNIYAARDHIVPPSASRSLPELLPNAQCTNQQVDCGHLGVFAGRRAQSQVPTLLRRWFERAD